MSDKTVSIIKAGICIFVIIWCAIIKFSGGTEANWPYAGILIASILTIGYLKQAFDKRY
ncbi:MAG: hypothetical protein UC708_08195 [Anaerovoracaceae bacterium]|nr:hypothetical protein [Bacillota bacterium]MEE0517840.1 hypothetical protein [Anaerovoracaceae bacterium]